MERPIPHADLRTCSLRLASALLGLTTREPPFPTIDPDCNIVRQSGRAGHGVSELPTRRPIGIGAVRLKLVALDITRGRDGCRTSDRSCNRKSTRYGHARRNTFNRIVPSITQKTDATFPMDTSQTKSA